MNRMRMGSAVTAQAMPMPITNCHVSAFGPIHPSYISMPDAAIHPNSNGVTSASPAVMPLTLRYFQAWRRSSSMPAIQTKTITAHHAMPFSA